MRKLISTAILAGFVGIALAQTEMPLDKQLPLDKKIKYGKLDNGLSYYVLHNEEPKDRASFYIVQNVGAILENNDQNGLAHFLEHMAFNGTKHFPDKGVLEYLEKYGIAFGRNINAYTSIDETVYNISNVPTSNSNLIDSTLLVLHDWSNYLSLSDEEIDKERGVIREEWRTRRSGRMRVYYETRKYLYQGSKYAERDVIGDTNVINNFDYDVLRDFYFDYYRTDLQAIVVVGDVDAEAIEQKIKDRFSGIPAVKKPKKREYFEVPGNKEPIVGIITDTEESNLRFSLYFKHPATPFIEKDLNYYREGVLYSLYSDMLGNRYSELVQTGNPPFIYAYGAYYNNERLMDVYNVGASLKEDYILGGIEAAIIENERVLRHGFTSSEFERAKVALLSEYERIYKERNKRNNDKIVREIQNHYLQNEPVPGIEYEYELIQKLLPNISLKELNELAPKWNTQENIVLIVSGPEKDSITYPSESELLEVLSKVKQLDIEPYVDKVSDKPLVPFLPEAGEVVNETNLSEFEAVEWELKNGAKVVIKTTDFKENEIILQAYSPGGSSLYEANDLPSVNMLGNFIGSFGIVEFNNVALKKMLTGKVVSISPIINELYEGFNGKSSIKDFEVMLQLLHLYFENPRFDEDAFNALKSRYIAYVANANNDINKAFRDSVQLIVSDYNERTHIFNSEYVESVNFETIQRVYNERFIDASDFKFVFVGNIQAEEAKPLIEKYIGSIKSINRKENWKDTEVNFPEKDTFKTFAKKMETPKTTIYLKMHGDDIKYNAETRMYMNVVAKLLDKRYLDVIREDEGGSYGVYVGSKVSHYPKEGYELTIKFDTDPEKAQKLKDIVYNEIEKLMNEGVKLEELEEVKSNALKEREENLRKNGYWMGAIWHYYRHNENIISTSALEDIVQEISPEKVQEFAKTYLSKTGKIEIVMTPAEK